MGDFNTAVLFELIREGGYSNHPDDRGGKTQYGITTATFNAAKSEGIINNSLNSVRDLTIQDATNIYNEMYWNKIKGDNLPSDLSVVVFDIAIQSGVTASIKALQNILGVSQDGIVGPQTLSAIESYSGNLVNDLLNSREARYRDIVENDPSQRVFLNGWLNRVNALRGFVNDINSGSFGYQPGIGFATDIIRDLFNTATVTPSPIILDLDGDGIETTSLTAGAYFDHDGNGFAEQTGWASSDDGILVMDRNNNGTIDNGKELFGDQTILNNGARAANGFQALAELDTNADGKIDANDAAFSNFKIWQDLDGDGYSASDELFTLQEEGIQSINTGYTLSSLVDANGNEHKQTGSFTKSDGTTATATDVWFKADKMYTIADEWLDVPDDIAALPDLQGYGNVYDLHQAMARDTTGSLKSLIEQFAAETDPVSRNSVMEAV